MIRSPYSRRRQTKPFGTSSRRPIAALCVLALAALLAAGAGSSISAAEKERRPNIVVIMADDMGYSDLGCYGGEIATPHLDSLARDGLRFTQFYNTARCWPTRASLLTGYYAQQVRRDAIPDVPSGGRGQRPEWARLLPDMLKPLGYRSYHSGKWHIDGLALPAGFDRSYDLRDQGRFFSPRVHAEDDQLLPPVERGSGYYATTAITEHALKCLREHAAEHGDRPFFLYLAHIAPHFPLHALPEDIARYRGRYDAGWERVRAERFARLREMGIVDGKLSDVEPEVGPPYHFPEALEILGPGEVNRPVPWTSLTDQQKEFQATKMAIHAAMIDCMDREIGRVLGQLREMGAFENTLILFLSDNGASAEIMVRNDGHDPEAEPGSAATHLCLGPGWSNCANTPFRRHKTWVHEGGSCTPLIAHWPRGIAGRGELRHDPGHVVDLVPTILDVVGGERLANWNGIPVPPAPGQSLRPLFVQDDSLPQRTLWFAHEGNQALRHGDWKLVKARDEAWELFNLSSDRTESDNVASRYPEKVRELETLWTRQWEEIRELATRDRQPSPRGTR